MKKFLGFVAPRDELAKRRIDVTPGKAWFSLDVRALEGKKLSS
jgi:hypothetical protein